MLMMPRMRDQVPEAPFRQRSGDVIVRTGALQLGPCMRWYRLPPCPPTHRRPGHDCRCPARSQSNAARSPRRGSSVVGLGARRRETGSSLASATWRPHRRQSTNLPSTRLLPTPCRRGEIIELGPAPARHVRVYAPAMKRQIPQSVFDASLDEPRSPTTASPRHVPTRSVTKCISHARRPVAPVIEVSGALAGQYPRQNSSPPMRSR